MRKLLNIVSLEGYPIVEQLKLEEALLRADGENWCLINRGSSPAIVMGISQVPEQAVNFKLIRDQSIPLVRRYSGGGTVFVDEHTFFVSLIMNHSALPCDPFPKDVMDWTSTLYQQLPFSLKENDYVIGEKKCGGNAQYFTKDRFSHHTSFLWDYSPEKMDYLLHPKKKPAYRQERNHQEFLCSLKPHFPQLSDLKNAFIEVLSGTFELLHRTREEAEEAQTKTHRLATHLIVDT